MSSLFQIFQQISKEKLLKNLTRSGYGSGLYGMSTPDKNHPVPASRLGTGTGTV
jgi:hypothetical protein